MSVLGLQPGLQLGLGVLQEDPAGTAQQQALDQGAGLWTHGAQEAVPGAANTQEGTTVGGRTIDSHSGGMGLCTEQQENTCLCASQQQTAGLVIELLIGWCCWQEVRQDLRSLESGQVFCSCVPSSSLSSYQSVSLSISLSLPLSKQRHTGRWNMINRKRK